MDYRENYKLWLEEKSLDPKLRAELEAIADDPREQEERFYTELEFGGPSGDNRRGHQPHEHLRRKARHTGPCGLP